MSALYGERVFRVKMLLEIASARALEKDSVDQDLEDDGVRPLALIYKTSRYGKS